MYFFGKSGWGPESGDEFNVAAELAWLRENIRSTSDDGLLTHEEATTRGLFDRKIAVNSKGQNAAGQFVIGATRLPRPPAHISRHWRSVREEDQAARARLNHRKTHTTTDEPKHSPRFLTPAEFAAIWRNDNGTQTDPDELEDSPR